MQFKPTWLMALAAAAITAQDARAQSASSGHLPSFDRSGGSASQPPLVRVEFDGEAARAAERAREERARAEKLDNQRMEIKQEERREIEQRLTERRIEIRLRQRILAEKQQDVLNEAGRIEQLLADNRADETRRQQILKQRFDEERRLEEIAIQRRREEQQNLRR
jgi:hypothetical protein